MCLRLGKRATIVGSRLTLEVVYQTTCTIRITKQLMALLEGLKKLRQFSDARRVVSMYVWDS
eukprot:4283923-Ditylum_brightwellii.AAC.1